jgi:hypothetical protein
MVQIRSAHDEVCRTEITCARCGARFERAGWTSLSLVERIGSPQVRTILLRWPDHLCIEIRACRYCGSEIASKCEQHD